MSPEILSQKVPNADPDFLRIMGSLPDPPAGIYEKVLGLMPRLHALFLQKRTAADKKDEPELARIINQETDLIRDALG
ncbi:hypothetical protein HZC53_00240 [Candidatus Uhrbacteria bacterium]|nr:hypothetical protein [Candidatus Uhrbacteria bacterium]